MPPTTPAPDAAPVRKRLTREESRARTRERLIEAAGELFAAQGFNGSSVEQIAERAGYTRGAFYGNFTDKGELLLALFEQRMARELDEVRALRAGASSFDEFLDELRAWHRERAKDLPYWLSLRAEFWLYALRNEELRPVLAERDKAARAVIGEGVKREFAAQGLAPPVDPDFLALIVHALEDGLLIQRVLCPDETRDEVVVDAVDLLMKSWTALAKQAEAELKAGRLRRRVRKA